MKSLLITIKPKWCAKIMNKEKTIEVRKNKALAKAIQKLIEENGFADIYVYCNKINKKHCHLIEVIDTDTGITEYEIDYYIGSGDCYEGKVAFKFRCYKVDRIWKTTTFVWCCESEMSNKLYEGSCLDDRELDRYFKPKKLGFNYTYGYAVHISDLLIFNHPKELSEFKHYKKFVSYDYTYTKKYIDWELRPLTKAPQNLCYVEVD